MTMSFGKHRGWDITELPDDYLFWLTTIELHGRLSEAVQREYERRRFADESWREYRTFRAQLAALEGAKP
jgi:hypothetical protein